MPISSSLLRVVDQTRCWLQGSTPPANNRPDATPRLNSGASDPRRTEDQRITTICIELADAIGGSPSIREMVLVAEVSERRVRKAFVDTYGLPPTRYFRNRALHHARDQFLTHPDDATVESTAKEHGFRHSGRFARYYTELFGELPSTTLRR
jgi:AraC-like DNA-binding protein